MLISYQTSLTRVSWFLKDVFIGDLKETWDATLRHLSQARLRTDKLATKSHVLSWLYKYLRVQKNNFESTAGIYRNALLMTKHRISQTDIWVSQHHFVGRERLDASAGLGRLWFEKLKKGASTRASFMVSDEKCWRRGKTTPNSPVKSSLEVLVPGDVRGDGGPSPYGSRPNARERTHLRC